MINPDDDDDVLISFWLHTHTKRSDISMINESVNKINDVKECNHYRTCGRGRCFRFRRDTKQRTWGPL